MQVVANDPFEAGPRKSLNLGHTLGHAIESTALQRNESVLHGEAVALGLVLESYLAERTGLASFNQAILLKIKSLGYDLQFAKGYGWEEIHQFVVLDKKNKDGQLRFALLKDYGVPVWDVPVNQYDVQKLWSDYTNHQIV